MKNILLCGLCFASIASFGQNGFFLEPGLGLGVTDVKASNPPYEYPILYAAAGWPAKPKIIFSYDPSLFIGYQHAHWSLTTGISFLKTGYSAGEADDKMTESYYHVMVPLIFSEQFNIGKHFFIRPGFGFALSYNTTAVEKYKDPGTYNYPGPPNSQPLPENEFDKIYFRVTGWEILRVQMGYKVNDRLNIIAGPEYQFMLSSFIKDNDNYEINRAYTVKMGITWSLHHSKQPEKPAGTYENTPKQN